MYSLVGVLFNNCYTNKTWQVHGSYCLFHNFSFLVIWLTKLGSCHLFKLSAITLMSHLFTQLYYIFFKFQALNMSSLLKWIQVYSAIFAFSYRVTQEKVYLFLRFQGEHRSLRNSYIDIFLDPQQKIRLFWTNTFTVREHSNLGDFPKFGEIANFKIGGFPQIWRNGYFLILFLGGKEGSKYAVIIHGHAPEWGENPIILSCTCLTFEMKMIRENIFLSNKISPNLEKFLKLGVIFQKLQYPPKLGEFLKFAWI